MELPKNYDETEAIAEDFEILEAGGYICQVVNVKEEKSKSEKRMLVVAFDIAEGKHKDFFKKKYDDLVKANKDPNKTVKYPNTGVHRIMIEDNEGNCNKFFKTFITAIENSNSGYNFKDKKCDERTLKGKLFGGIFGIEEYLATDGKVKEITKLRWIRSTETIKSGNYTVPEKILLPKTENNFTYNTGDSGDDLPF